MNRDAVAALTKHAHTQLKGGKAPLEVTRELHEALVSRLDTAARRERILTLCIQHGQGREPAQLVQDAAMFLAWIDGEPAPSVQLGPAPTQETTNG